MGLVKGLVVDNIDPEKIGRIKARVPHLHGTDTAAKTQFMSTSAIQWAYPCMPFYSGYDCGSFIIPPIGTYVWLMEVEGDNPYFVYIGGSVGGPPSSQKSINLMTDDNPNNMSMGKVNVPAGSVQIPLDLNNTEYAQSGVVFKSQKGHTIIYSDQDGAEFFSIIDRSGDMIKFDCPVSKSENSGNGAARRANNEHSGGKVTIKSKGSTIVMDNGTINITADSGSSISMSKGNITVTADTIVWKSSKSTVSM